MYDLENLQKGDCINLSRNTLSGFLSIKINSYVLSTKYEPLFAGMLFMFDREYTIAGYFIWIEAGG